MKRRMVRLKRRKKVRYTIILIVIVLIIGTVYFSYLYISSYNNEIMKSNIVDFVFILSDGKVVFARDYSMKKMVYLIVFPPYGFDGERLLPLYGEPGVIVENIKKILNLDKADGGCYYSSIDEESFDILRRKFNIEDSKNFVDFTEKLSRRGFKFLDLFRVSKISRILRTRGTIGKQELFRFLHSVGKHAVLIHEVKALLPEPIIVRYRDKEYRRMYISQDSLRSIKEVIK